MLIALTGFMASGKSSVGKALAGRLCCPFTDLDSYIEERQGCSIPELFARGGEEYFRSLELEALKEIVCSEEVTDSAGTGRSVLSLGGGTILRAEAQDLLRGALKVYLKASVPTVRLRLGDALSKRPVLNDASVEDLLAARAPVYEACADIIVDVDDATPDVIASRIAMAVEYL